MSSRRDTPWGAFALPVKMYEPSPDTGSILIVDANEDCVCMADDAAVAAQIVRMLNALLCAACATDGCWLALEALELLRKDQTKLDARVAKENK